MFQVSNFHTNLQPVTLFDTKITQTVNQKVIQELFVKIIKRIGLNSITYL